MQPTLCADSRNLTEGIVVPGWWFSSTHCALPLLVTMGILVAGRGGDAMHEPRMMFPTAALPQGRSNHRHV
jgi:hypothetical protein